MTRIGTWNLEGRWGDSHARLLDELDCDVLLLTEVRRYLRLLSYCGHQTAADMTARRAWAGVYSREPLVPRPDPHPASALATVGGTTYCSSILGATVWGGDFNHAMAGCESAGSPTTTPTSSPWADPHLSGAGGAGARRIRRPPRRTRGLPRR